MTNTNEELSRLEKRYRKRQTGVETERAALKEADQQKAIKAREEIVRAKPIRREDMQMEPSTGYMYPYLAAEDASFCRAFRLSEDTFLELHGGLGAYKQFEMGRNHGRSAVNIPQLPGTIRTQDLETMKITKLNEKQLAAHLIGEQRNKVTEAQKIVKMNESFAAQAKAEATNKAAMQKREHDRLAQEIEVRLGYKPGTQSSEDAIATELGKIKRGLRS